MKTKRRGLLLLILFYVLLIATIVVIAFIINKSKSSLTPDADATPTAFNQTEAIDIQQTMDVLPTLTASPSTTPTASLTLTKTPTHTATITQTASPTEGPPSTFTAIPLPTSTFTPTVTFTPTITSTPTPNPGLIWEGIWTGYFGQEIGSVYQTVINITVTGNQILALADFRGGITTFKGTFRDDFRLLTGTWSCPPAGGNFTWYLPVDNQFVGNRDNIFAYCGSRMGELMPEPCFGP